MMQCRQAQQKRPALAALLRQVMVTVEPAALPPQAMAVVAEMAAEAVVARSLQGQPILACLS